MRFLLTRISILYRYDRLHFLIRRTHSLIGCCPARHGLPRNAAEHGRVGDAIAAEAIGAMHAAGILARGEEALDRRAAVGREFHVGKFQRCSDLSVAFGRQFRQLALQSMLKYLI